MSRWNQAHQREREYLAAVAAVIARGEPATATNIAAQLGRTPKEVAVYRERLIAKGTSSQTGARAPSRSLAWLASRSGPQRPPGVGAPARTRNPSLYTAPSAAGAGNSHQTSDARHGRARYGRPRREGRAGSPRGLPGGHLRRLASRTTCQKAAAYLQRTRKPPLQLLERPLVGASGVLC